MSDSVKDGAKEWVKDIVVAVVIISVILGSLYVYTGLWPPMVVIESGSMQHSDDHSYIGVIDTGDIVLSKHTSHSDVITYVKGRSTGYETYGDYGDVIIYRPLGRDVTPIIHRAILYLEWNSTASFDVPELSNLNYGTDYTTDSGSWHGIRSNIVIYDYGYAHKDLVIRLDNLLRFHHSGYITGGDHNIASGYRADQNAGICPEPVEDSWVLAKAVGELPWFGLIKLMLSGTLKENPAPTNSWVMLFISIAVLLFVPTLVEKTYNVLRRRDDEMPEELEEDRRDGEDEV